MLKIILAVVALLAIAAFGFIWFSGAEVALKPPTLGTIGSSTPVTVAVTAPHGVKSFTATVAQEGKKQVVFATRQPTKETALKYTFPVGKQQADFLKEGPAKVIFEAVSDDFRGQTTVIAQDVKVVTRPPSVIADGFQHYINQGGAELVTLTVSGNWSEAGVHAGQYTARSFPLPGQPENSSQRFSLFPYPSDLTPDTIPVAFAKNSAGNEAIARFWVKVFPKKFHDSKIELNDAFLNKVANDIDPGGTGDLVTRYLKINRDIRKANNQQLSDMRFKTENKILWSGAFLRLPGKTESYFADRRSYFYNGKKVDEQTHLGFDLAGTIHMPVKASNSGKVIWADRLGIYGNCVVIDHGYALQTIYGHMSKIDVKPGDMVQKNQQIGLTGDTGLAGGDHLHFSMQVDGVQINPIEWWDEHWIKDRILSKIGNK